MAATCGKCKAKNQTVAHVRACYGKADPLAAVAMDILASALGATPVAVLPAVEAPAACDTCPCQGDAEAHLANAELDAFVALTTPKAEQTALVAPELPAVKPAKVELVDGMYLMDGTIYKVQHAVHGSGKQYAKKLVKATGEDWTFEYAPGVVTKLTPAHMLTLEAAAKFGALYGTCACCGRTLTDEKSIALGIGPVCAKRLGKQLAAV